MLLPPGFPLREAVGESRLMRGHLTPLRSFTAVTDAAPTMTATIRPTPPATAFLLLPPKLTIPRFLLREKIIKIL